VLAEVDALVGAAAAEEEAACVVCTLATAVPEAELARETAADGTDERTLLALLTALLTALLAALELDPEELLPLAWLTLPTCAFVHELPVHFWYRDIVL